MDTMLLSIAGRIMEIRGNEEVSMLRLLPGFTCFEVTEPSAHSHKFTLSFGEDISVPVAITILYTFDFTDSDIKCQFGRAGDQYFFKMFPSFGNVFCMRYTFGDCQMVATSCANPSMLRFAMWFAYSLFAVPTKAVPIHASTIVYHDEAVLFLGESGTGKSTHTRLWLQHIPGCSLLNDDSPILSVDRGRIQVSGSPWSGKTHCYHSRTVPLKAIVRLSQAPQNEIRALSTLEAFSALQPSCPPALNSDDAFSDAIVNVISDVLQCVPLYKMKCLPDREAALTSLKAIYLHE